jgi:hypothetical protein
LSKAASPSGSLQGGKAAPTLRVKDIFNLVWALASSPSYPEGRHTRRETN